VSNGIADKQSVLVVPFLSASANDGMNATPDPIVVFP